MLLHAHGTEDAGGVRHIPDWAAAAVAAADSSAGQQVEGCSPLHWNPCSICATAGVSNSCQPPSQFLGFDSTFAIGSATLNQGYNSARSTTRWRRTMQDETALTITSSRIHSTTPIMLTARWYNDISTGKPRSYDDWLSRICSFSSCEGLSGTRQTFNCGHLP